MSAMGRMLSPVVLSWAVVSPLFLYAQPTAPQGTRPTAEPLREQQVSPQLQRILELWHQKSAQVKKLQGEHQRYTYDRVYQIEHRAQGVFYYEAPDRGRIDLLPEEIKPGQVGSKKDPKTGKPYEVKADKAERWICTGERLMSVNDVEKQVEIFEIPEYGRGRNIMEGPLPFLFGMPPDLAKRRYQLKLLQVTEKQVWIAAKPNWKQDAANYKEAKIILDAKMFLPVAVQLIDPSGNKETVYTFSKMKVNHNGGLFKIWNEKPFEPSFRGYKIVNHEAKQMLVPSVVRFPWKNAKASLEKMGYQVNLVAGKKTNDPRLIGIVEKQHPAPKALLNKGETVSLAVYVAGNAVPANQKQPLQGMVVVPKVIDMPWQQAKKKLEAAGFTVSLQPGRVVQDPRLHYVVYEQTPPANAQVKRTNNKITLVVFDDPNRKKN